MLRTFLLLVGGGLIAGCTLTVEGSYRGDTGPDVNNSADGMTSDRPATDVVGNDVPVANDATDNVVIGDARDVTFVDIPIQDVPVRDVPIVDVPFMDVCSNPSCFSDVSRIDIVPDLPSIDVVLDVPPIDVSMGDAIFGDVGLVCRSSAECPPNLQCCNMRCVDTMSDPNNCGSCGNVVCHGEICLAGMRQCTPGYSPCAAGGTTGCLLCRNLASDPANCGTCGAVCPSGELCRAGVCSTTTTCTGTICSGICTNLLVDDIHCGSCSNACNPGQACVAGVCHDVSSPTILCGPVTASCMCSTCAGGSTCCMVPIRGLLAPICISGPACPG
jgi:hypothetical protein